MPPSRSSRFTESSEAVNAATDAVTALLAGGRLRLYTAPKPSDADVEPSPGAILLAELRFSEPAFDRAVEGRALAWPLPPARAGASGEAAWFRAMRANRRPIFDGTVGLEGSGADLELGAVLVARGAEIVITQAQYAHPKS